MVGVISIFIKPVSGLDTSILFIPIWARIIGFLTIASVLISIPLWAINEIVSRKGTIQEVKRMIYTTLFKDLFTLFAFFL